ncbi:MAG: NADH-quinone oxidoreductase subunit 5 family protein [Acidimicrobiales bacterium]
MLLTLVVVPVVAGLAVWTAGDDQPRFRSVLALGAPIAMLGPAIAVAIDPRSSSMRWGAGLDLRLTVADAARAPVVLVAFVSLAVVAYALGYGDERGRSRMVGLLLAFAGAMELLLLADDLLTLIIGWEFVGVISWGLIAHHWRADGPANAAHAFLATRAGDLGLFAAAGAAFAATGSLDFAALSRVDGGWVHVVAAGVVLAAVAKSAQVPFSPWLFSDMAGPTPASALLHSATMVAAGTYLIARLQPFLATVAWFAPVAIAIGLTTALAGGVVAYLQPEAKKLLAGSTSAQYGLMFVAVGAGYPSVAIAHLVAHGLLKALLFISAGVAIDASGTEQLVGMRLGRRLPLIAGLTAVGALALAAIPPLGAAWTKEEVVAAATHHAPWIGVGVVVAGGLSALYAARFQLVVYGRSSDEPTERDEPEPVAMSMRRRPGAVAGLGLLAVGSLALVPLWSTWGEHRLLDVIGGELPTAEAWELPASLAAAAVAIYAAVVADRRGLLVAPATTAGLHRVADWLGIPTLTRRLVVDPTLALAAAASRFDDHVIDAAPRAMAATGRWLSGTLARGDDLVVDAGVRGVARLGTWLSVVLDRIGEWSIDGVVEGFARLTGAAGRDGRRLQSGMTHHYYAGIATVLAVLTLATVLWS